MNCLKNMDMVYEDDSMSIFNHIRVGLHTFFCSACTEEIEHHQAARAIMREDFFPHSLSIEESIMTKIYSQQEFEEEQTESAYSAPGTFSTRGWVIAGIVLIISLVTVFFGLDFKNLANESGMSFLLPMGITIGIALTIYGALFIGSHLKEFTERFDL
jgi:hypothetical protein